MNLLRLLFPETCVGCGSRGSSLCRECVKRVPLAGPADVPDVAAAYEYGNKIVSRAIHECKYHRRDRAFCILAAEATPLFAEYIAERHPGIGPERTVLVPVPQSNAKTRSRGFSQSALLARRLAALGTVQPLLTKTRPTTPQARLASRRARLRNVERTMRSTEGLSPRTLYVVVDDVTTTGATFLEARRALKAAGARHVIGFAIAHGYKGDL